MVMRELSRNVKLSMYQSLFDPVCAGALGSDHNSKTVNSSRLNYFPGLTCEPAASRR